MQIRKEDLEELRSMGVIVDTYACSVEEFKEQLRKHYESWLRHYYVNWDYVDGVRVETFDQEGYENAVNKYVEEDLNANPTGWRGRWYDATTFYIKVGDMLFKRSCNKSKLITTELVLKIIAKDSKVYTGVYGEFAINLNKMFKERIGSSCWIYPTTYGIGVWFWLNIDANECIEKVRGVLDELGIEYYTEFSDAHWVYRFKISKKEINRKKLIA